MGETRRPLRLADDKLKVDIMPSSCGEVIVKVTHLPTRRFTTETGQTGELAERKGSRYVGRDPGSDAPAPREENE
jgi:hypothetical protein